ncbi:MAG: hypothetical protein WCO84_02380 [bacterium]
MDSILDNFKETKDFHHAYLVVGDIKKSIAKLNELLAQILGVQISRNPDYYIYDQDVFDIEEGRKIRQISQSKSLSGGKRIFIIGARRFTEQSQNAILKTLEEPIPNTHFFIITPSERILLPTIKSRLKKIIYELDSVVGDSAKKFLSSQIPERILMVADLIDEDMEPSSQRIIVEDFISDIEGHIFNIQKNSNFLNYIDYQKIFSEISKIKKYSGDISSAPKLLLEYLSFLCPVVEEKK